MKTKSLANRTFLRLISIGVLTLCIASVGAVLAQQPAPLPPTPVPPPETLPPVEPPVAPVPSSADAPTPKRSVKPQELPVPNKPPYGAPHPDARPPKKAAPSRAAMAPALARSILNEDLSSNPQASVEKYEEIVASFDAQREVAAQAMLRLGESYRKMKRFDEAHAMYARVLREFIDLPEVSKMSQRLLAENAPMLSRAGADSPNLVPNPEEQDFIKQELALLGQQLEENDNLIKTGLAPTSSRFSLQREILQLQQRLARAKAPASSTAASAQISATQTSASSQRSQPDDASKELRSLQAELAELHSQLSVLSDATQRDNISTQIIKDPRFAELKANYEQRLLDGSGDELSKKQLDAAAERLMRWINLIYTPELENSIAIKKSRLKELEELSKPRTR